METSDGSKALVVALSTAALTGQFGWPQVLLFTLPHTEREGHQHKLPTGCCWPRHTRATRGCPALLYSITAQCTIPIQCTHRVCPCRYIHLLCWCATPPWHGGAAQRCSWLPALCWRCWRPQPVKLLPRGGRRACECCCTAVGTAAAGPGAVAAAGGPPNLNRTAAATAAVTEVAPSGRPLCFCTWRLASSWACLGHLQL